MKYILLNNNSSVAYDDSDATDIKVYIDGKLHDFKESTENRIDYAMQQVRPSHDQENKADTNKIKLEATMPLHED